MLLVVLLVRQCNHFGPNTLVYQQLVATPAPSVEGPARRRRSVRQCLIAVVAVSLTLSVAASAWLMGQWISSEEAKRDQRFNYTLIRISTEIDREFASTKAILTALGASRALQTDALEEFRRRASQVSSLLGARIVLSDPARASLPQEVALPETLRKAAERAVQSREFTVSSVFVASPAGESAVAALLPVMKGDAVAHVLSMDVPTRTIDRLLSSVLLAEGQILLVLDEDGSIIAHSARPGEFGGTKVSLQFLKAISAHAGTWNDLTFNGVQYHALFRRSNTTGWVEVIGEPQSAYRDIERNAWFAYGAISVLLFATGVGLAYRTGNRMDGDVGVMGIDRPPTREEFSLLLDSSPNGVLAVDISGRILFANTRVARLFGYEMAELVGNSVELLIPDRRRRAQFGWQKAFARLRMTESPTDGASMFAQARRKDGGLFPVEIGLTPLVARAQGLTMITVVDITERRNAKRALARESALRVRLGARLLDASEGERRRLALELHDHAGQALTALALQLKSLEGHLDVDGLARLPKLCRMVDDVGRQLHHAVWNLRPPSIAELGLVTALEDCLAKSSALTGIRGELRCEGSGFDDLPDELRVTLYRVVQEALTNIAKHARSASKVTVTLDVTASSLRMLIEDDGVGFDAHAGLPPSTSGGFGLLGMRERLLPFGGELLVKSAPGKGTVLTVRVPIKKKGAVA